MAYRPYTPLRHDGAFSQPVYQNIYFTPGNSSPRPIQRQLPIAYRFHPPVLWTPFLHRTHIPITKNITSINAEQVTPIRKFVLASTEECVRKFKEWRDEKGVFSSPEGIENGLAMEMAMPRFLDFKKALDIDDDEKFPKYSYNSSSSLLTIQCMPCPLHEKVVSTVSAGFTIARNSLPDDLRLKIDIVHNQHYKDFQGLYDGSEKTPDTAVEITNADGAEVVKFVLEVGFAESYEMLLEDVKQWIEGREASCLVMIVNIEESPGYKCPTRGLSDVEFSQLGFPPRHEINTQTFTLNGPYGPACYKGFQWVGQVTGFVEMYKRDPVTKMAKLISPPGRMNLLTMGNARHIHFRLRDFMDITRENDGIPIHWGDYITNLGRYIKQVAADRCRAAIMSREGRVDTLDRDYEP